MNVLALIPARGGSKGVPGKNSRLIAGKSLVQRAYECAVASGVADRVVLSTDDPAIAASAATYGLEVTGLRPAELARDDTPMIDVAIHALTTLAAGGYCPDALLLLQPTSPLRRPEHVRQACALLGDNDAVCTVTPLPLEMSPHFVMRIGADGYLSHFMPDGAAYTRRQDVPRAYKRDGTVYLTKSSVLLDRRSFYGDRCVPLIVSAEESLSIDDLDHWREAERRLLAGSVSTVSADR
ncbi:MAG: cytidylyltransferase domain-containing protein [Gemmatimonadaceae bacterium]